MTESPTGSPKLKGQRAAMLVEGGVELVLWGRGPHFLRRKKENHKGVEVHSAKVKAVFIMSSGSKHKRNKALRIMPYNVWIYRAREH